MAVWTASQSNREASKADVVGLDNMSESYGKAQVADLVVTIARKPMEKDEGTARLFVAKNRAGRDGLLFPISIDTARSLITIISDEHMTLDEMVKKDEGDMRSLLLAKWKEVSEENNAN